MIYALGPISGANFNPAVTFAVYFQGAFPLKDAGLYVVSQLVGGFLGALSAGFLVGTNNVASAVPEHGTTFLQALGAEFFYTWMLVFVVLNVALAQANEGNQFFGLAIGLVIVAGGYGVGRMSGGAFNPAVALGLNLATYGEKKFWSNLGWVPLYVAAEIGASLVAIMMFHIVRPETKTNAVSDHKYSPIKYIHKFEGLFPPKFISEFLGTFILVLTVGMNVLPLGTAGPSPAAVLSIAASLMAMIYSLGSVSGAHFNPAVTVALLVLEKIDDKMQAAKYVLSQVLGGLAAGASSWLLAVNFEDSSRESTFAFEPKGNYSLVKALVAEMIATFTLCYVVLCVALPPYQSAAFFGYAIGACVICGGIAIGNISGGSLNPAVTIGISSLNFFAGIAEKDKDAFAWILYVLFELLGGVLAAAIYKFVTHSHLSPTAVDAREREYDVDKRPFLMA